MAFSFRRSHLSANIKPNVVVQFDPGVSFEPQVSVSAQSCFFRKHEVSQALQV